MYSELMNITVRKSKMFFIFFKIFWMGKQRLKKYEMMPGKEWVTVRVRRRKNLYKMIKTRCEDVKEQELEWVALVALQEAA